MAITVWPAVEQPPERGEQHLDVDAVKAGGRLVEQEQRRRADFAAERDARRA